jgi:hypothetical protein
VRQLSNFSDISWREQITFNEMMMIQKQEKVVGASLLSTQYNGAMYRDWWVWNQDNASELSDMYTRGMLFQ